ncbi:MAG: divalent-cation tolerance protein CutA [Pseudomonadota bacterium]
MSEAVWVVLCNCPDQDSADRLAMLMVERRLAACASRLPGVRAVYRWQGRIEHTEECSVLFKTTADRYPALESCLKTEHPYEIPEIIAWPISAGLGSYLDWVRAETRGDADA